MVAAQETVRAAQAGVDRAAVLSRTIGALVNAQLRPGADASRAQAELAAARTQLIQAQQAVAVTSANLARFTGLDPEQIVVSAPKLLQLPPEQTTAALDTAANPLSLEQNAVLDQLKAQLRILERSYFPRFFFKARHMRAEPEPRSTERIWGGSMVLRPLFRITHSASV